MPITLNEIAANTATVTFQYGDKPITLVFYPGRITEKVLTAGNFAKRGEDAASIEAGVKDFNDILATLIESWDVLENDGKTMIPIDADRFADIPLIFRTQVFQEIIGAFRPEMMAPQMNGK
jgi:hypothetical protein